MDTGKTYHDSEGNERTIWQMVREEPEWAAARVQEGEKAIERAKELEADNNRLTLWLEWVSAHSVVECGVPGDEFPYLNMPPNEGACAALRGESIEDCESA